MNEEKEDVNSYIEKGETLLNDKKYNEALLFFNKAIECSQFESLLNTIRSEVQCKKGFILWKQFDLDSNIEAIKCFDKAIELNPMNSLAFFSKSFSLTPFHRNNESLECIKQAIKLERTDEILPFDKKAQDFLFFLLSTLFFPLIVITKITASVFLLFSVFLLCFFKLFHCRFISQRSSKNISIILLFTFLYFYSNIYILIIFFVLLISTFFVWYPENKPRNIFNLFLISASYVNIKFIVYVFYFYYYTLIIMKDKEIPFTFQEIWS